MLALFRSKKNSLKWVLWLVVVILGAGMVLLFVNPPTGSSGAFGGEVALVAGTRIGALEFRREYGNLIQLYQQQFGDQFEQFREQMRLGDQALNRLVNQYAVSYEAERLGLSATPSEISGRIAALPVFQEGDTGRFIGVTRYQQILAANGLAAADFEDGIRRQILREKLISLLSEGIEPRPAEIRQEFVNRNQKVKIAYVSFDPDVLSTEAVDEEELASYYEKNSSAYTIPEKRKVAFIRIPISAEAVSVSEADIQQKLQDVPLQLQVRASHILFRVPPEGDDEEARQKASQVLKRIRAGSDFAEMAKTYSEDDGSPEDGDLGFFPRGQMVPEFENVAFSLKPNEVSDLVKSPFGIHIIKTTVAPGSPEESQRVVAEFQLRQEKALAAAEERASNLVGKLKEGSPLADLAAGEGLETGESEFFSLVDPDPALGVRGDFNQQVFALTQGEVVGPYQSSSGLLVGVLQQIQTSRLQALEEVRNQLVSDFREFQREGLAVERAKRFYGTLRDGKSIFDAGAEQGLKVVTTDFFGKGTTVDDTIKFSPVLHERVFVMEKGEASPAVPIAGKQVVFVLLDKTEIDPEAFEQSRDEIAGSLREAKQNEFVSAYIQNVIDRMRREQLISVNQEILDGLTG